ncbi:efflux RND transporter permease subunit, partial [Pontibacter rugosus]
RFYHAFRYRYAKRILLVSHYQLLLQQGHSLYESVILGSRDRLDPILMTALTAESGAYSAGPGR